ncbi:MAG: hypothetical protein M3O80_06430, partial [Chloroflexota bacterium]|nr:hypothetical protein [Chloroflexota bacterium]
VIRDGSFLSGGPASERCEAQISPSSGPTGLMVSAIDGATGRRTKRNMRSRNRSGGEKGMLRKIYLAISANRPWKTTLEQQKP